MNTPTRSVLIVAPHLPEPDTLSGEKRLFALCELLATRHRVDFFPFYNREPKVHERYRSMLDGIGVGALDRCPRWLKSALAKRRYDVVIIEFWENVELVADLIRKKQPQAALIVDSVDIHFVREASAVSVGSHDPQQAEATRAGEVAAYRRSDGVIVVTDSDRDALAAVGEIPAIHLIPNIQRIAARADHPRAPEALFVGGFDHAPNADGICWFVDQVWPRVLAALPEARLTIVGSKPRPNVLALADRDGVEVVGYVPDVAPYLDRAAVSIAPLRFGAGMKGKVTEALGHGLPVVATSFGVEGLSGRHGEHYWEANEPNEFSAGLIEFFTDPARARGIGLAGQALVAGLCSPEVVRAAALDMVEAAAAGRRHGRGLPLLRRAAMAGERAFDAALAVGPIRSAHASLKNLIFPSPGNRPGDANGN